MTTWGRKAAVGSFRAAGVLVCVATLLPVFQTDEWWVRLFDFPRLQVACLGLLVLAPALVLFRRFANFDRCLAFLIAAAVAAQAIQIYPYTRLARTQVIRAEEPGLEVRVFAANVLQHNQRTNALLELIARKAPDLVLLTEIDPWWDAQLAALQSAFPHSVKQPLTNTYGIALYSKLELTNAQIRYLVEPAIPSIRTQVKLRDGRTISFYGVHPRPPGRPGPSGEPGDSGPRDAELVIVAKEVRSIEQPVIVAGDFNDVAWSHTTRLFQRLSRLLDPRVGRGLFNTYNANYWFLRFPLDHLFHSQHFAVAGFERLPHIGSDHFPIFTTLRLLPDAPQRQEPPPLKASDPAEAERKVQEAADP